MNYTRTIIVFLLFLLPFFSFSQTFEVGLIGGISTYEGDLSPSNGRVNIGKINPMGGIFARYNFNNYITLRAGGNFGIVAAAQDPDKDVRNLSFRSRVIEGHLVGEINILGYEPYNLEKPWSPYIFGGVAFFNFNPQAEFQDEWVDLQPLGTEGQGLSQYPDRDKYKLTEFSIPLGMGVKYALSDTWNIGIEVGVRKTFTDYLDDASTTYVENNLLLEQSELAAALADRSIEPRPTGSRRGNPDNDDWYVFTGITISKNFIDNGLVGSRRRGRRSKTGCPTF